MELNQPTVLLGKEASDRARLALIQDRKYTVREADTEMKIALLFGLRLSDLEALNPGVIWTKLKIGQQVVVQP